MANYPALKIENYDPILDQVLTAREVDELWGLPEGTVKQALHRNKIRGRRSKGTWLVSRRDIEVAFGPQPPPAVFEIEIS